jgi:hypothetical protein
LAALVLSQLTFAQEPPPPAHIAWFQPAKDPTYVVIAERGPAPTGIEGPAVDEGCVALDAAGNLTLREGFAFEGPSWVPDEPRLMLASAYRDALYRLMAAAGRIEATGSARRKADAVFVRIAGDAGYRHTLASLRVLHQAGRLAVARPAAPDGLSCAPVPARSPVAAAN